MVCGFVETLFLSRSLCAMVMGFALFTTAFLFGSASSAIVLVATHFLVFFNTFKNLVPLIRNAF